MSIDSPTPEKPTNKLADGGDASGSAKHPADTNDSLATKGGDTAAKQYGKAAQLGDLPTNQDLLDQIKKDQAAKVYDFNRRPYKEEKETAQKMTTEDLKDVGAIVEAIKHHKLGEAHQDPTADQNLGDVLKRFQDDPARLLKLADMVKVELERQNLSQHYQVDVQSYSEHGKAAAAFLVSNTRDNSSVGLTTKGSKASKELLNLIYD